MHLLAERVNAMTDEDGQAAIACCIKSKALFNALQSAHERAAWALVNEPSAFRHAEEIRHADLNRRGQMWDLFTAPRDKVIRDDANSIKKFRKRLHQIFPDSQNILVEMYTRMRQESSGDPVKIYQTSIYVESRPESYMALENGQIVTKTRRPLQEIIVCYTAAAGTLEIIAAAKEQREKVAAVFHEVFLTHPVASSVLSNDYDLSSLLAERSFLTDIEDNIKAVSVLSIKLRSISGDGTITLEVPNHHDRTIYQQAKEWFEGNSPFLGGFIVQSAKMAIQFYPETDEQRAEVLPIKISLPNRCDLQSQPEAKRILGEKYLQQWGLRGRHECQLSNKQKYNNRHSK